MATWREDIISAFEELGGKAYYSDLYTQLAAKRGRRLTSNDEAGVRKEIERHSSDSDNWDGLRPDLFYSVSGLGSGHWGLREKN